MTISKKSLWEALKNPPVVKSCKNCDHNGGQENCKPWHDNLCSNVSIHDSTTDDGTPKSGKLWKWNGYDI